MALENYEEKVEEGESNDCPQCSVDYTAVEGLDGDAEKEDGD